MFVVCCLLLFGVGCRWLAVDCCLLLVVYILLRIAWLLLFLFVEAFFKQNVERCALFVGCCLLCVVSFRFLFGIVGCLWLFVLLIVVRCLLFVVRSLLFAMCCFLFVVSCSLWVSCF